MANNNDNKVLNVPHLRFPEFTGEWEKLKLDAFTERVMRKNKNNLSKLPLTISAQYGLVDQITFFNKVVASTDMSNYYLLKKGEFAYNKSYSSDYPWGAIKRLDNYEQGALSSLYICFAPQDNVESDFILQYFESPKWHKGVSEIAVEGARNHGLLNISVQDFFHTYHYIPKDKKEQTKIAKLLMLLDKRIATQNKIIEDLKKLKSAISRIIFRNAALIKIQNLCEVIMGQSPLSSSYNSNNEGLPLIQGNLDILDGVTISRIYTNEPTKISLQNDLILTVRAPVGIVAENKMKVCIGRGVCALRNKSAIPTIYIYYALDYFSYKWKQIEQGSTFTSINGDDVKNFAIPLVKDAEYSCTFLSKVDALIKCSIGLHLNYIKQKQYLLLQLFI